jgi:hypothetical protein
LNANRPLSKQAVLRRLFGDNRAEWPPADFKEIFVQPTYLAKLESMRPCILVGGRGTGKTTALQSLRYDLSCTQLESVGLSFDDQEYLGILVRMNKNRVRAFAGTEVPEEKWSKFFAHFFNLQCCAELVQLTEWLFQRTGASLSASSIELIANDLGIHLDEGDGRDIFTLKTKIKLAISSLQIQVNNPSEKSVYGLSIAEAPLRTFAEALESDGLLGGRVIFCCVDEYENLYDYQQAIINTYVKHAEPPLSYKIGVRKNGLRNHQTLDGQDLLKAPDDYAEIEIADEGFEYFAKAVAESRLAYARNQGIDVSAQLKDFLAELTFAQEAALLGAERVADEVLDELRRRNYPKIDLILEMQKTDSYFLRYWQETEKNDIRVLADDWIANPEEWRTRLGNYGFPSLFWLSKGRKGVRIRKYYCGERVYISLAAGNIRYFLEMIDAAIGYELEENPNASPIILSGKAQTLAARDVGGKRLNQLEGLADHGVQLKRLVLAIGKVFFELARSPAGRAPEVTSFTISGDGGELDRLRDLLSEGVGHLAFEVNPRTKATSSAEMRDDEYRLHRIFSAFFEISYRKKRRMTFDAKKLISVLGDRPSAAIGSLIDGRDMVDSDELPEQLAFFSAFYDESNSRE